MSFLHKHPYPPFFPEDCQKLIVGTIPPPRFSMGQLMDGDVDFCYGSKYGLLWPILDAIYGLDLRYSSDDVAIQQRKTFLKKYKIGICDMVEQCQRSRINASDLGMSEIVLRDLIRHLSQQKSIHTLLFMGGLTKNGPAYFFKRTLRRRGLSWKLLSASDGVKVYAFQLESRTIKAVCLTSPSSAANRSIGAHALYKRNKQLNSSYTTLDFRIEQYRPFFVN